MWRVTHTAHNQRAYIMYTPVKIHFLFIERYRGSAITLQLDADYA